jgi:hypothetical protein
VAFAVVAVEEAGDGMVPPLILLSLLLWMPDNVAVCAFPSVDLLVSCSSLKLNVNVSSSSFTVSKTGLRVSALVIPSSTWGKVSLLEVGCVENELLSSIMTTVGGFDNDKTQLRRCLSSTAVECQSISLLSHPTPSQSQR